MFDSHPCRFCSQISPKITKDKIELKTWDSSEFYLPMKEGLYVYTIDIKVFSTTKEPKRDMEMKLIPCNIRGMRGPSKKCSYRRMISKLCPYTFMIHETMMRA